MDFSVKDTSKVIRDCRQITLVTLNGFCLLSKAPSHHPYPLFLKGNIKLDGIPSKTTWKTYTFFILYLKFWSYFLSKVTSHSYQLFYILLFYFNFYISRYIFYNILEVYSTLSKKNFRHEFSFSSDSLKPTPHPWRPKSAESVTKTFCRCSLITISQGNFEVIFLKFNRFRYTINMMDAVPTLWRVILFGWNKATEKWLHENKNSWEMSISTTYVIKHDVKVGELIFV